MKLYESRVSPWRLDCIFIVMKKINTQKYVLITGASGLIGTALCEKYLANDFMVYALDLKANKTLKHHNLKFIKCDLSKEESIKKAISKIDQLHVVINNAAKTDLTFKNFKDVTLKLWNEGLAVNLTSYFLITKYTHEMLKKTKGSIINIASTRHLMSEPNTVIYSASKGGIVSLTHSLALTFAKSIRVNSISPGWIDSVDAKLSEKDHSQHPVGRVGIPEDIAEMAYFLSSEAAGFITGSDFVVDGGMTKKMIYE